MSSDSLPPCGTVIVSACLAGLDTRYDAGSRPSPALERYVNMFNIIPVCPEQLGGLSTPRLPAEIVGGDGFDVLDGKARVIIRENGKDVTRQFVNGAMQCMKIARLAGVNHLVLKAGSPSCAVSGITGVTAALFILDGFEVREI